MKSAKLRALERFDPSFPHHWARLVLRLLIRWSFVIPNAIIGRTNTYPSARHARSLNPSSVFMLPPVMTMMTGVSITIHGLFSTHRHALSKGISLDYQM